MIGPGLGRNEHVGQIVYTAIALARQHNIQYVVKFHELMINTNFKIQLTVLLLMLMVYGFLIKITCPYTATQGLQIG